MPSPAYRSGPSIVRLNSSIGWPIDSKEIALTVSEPGTLTKQIALAVSDLGDVVDRPQARKVVFLEHHSAHSQPLHGRLDVFNLPRHLSSVLSWGGAARLEEHELPLTTAIEQTSGPLFARFETQLLCVERFGPLQILYREPRRDLGVFKHSHRPPSYRVALHGIAGQVGRYPLNATSSAVSQKPWFLGRSTWFA